ncbi:MAG: prepilin-type N-terminal cleavage/methylation domain-containing protein [Thiobacillus sp.]|nr:prepilin-type N-terminal cleavage/methylation domain-containing protein [Thiobacillus sp.]
MNIGLTKQRGFTLVELIIVVLVIGILSAIAIPSYMDYLTRSRRAEAQSYMMELALREEKFRANNAAYADHTVAAINVQNSGFYTFTITAGANTYTIVAQAQGTQATRDAACKFLKTTQGGDKCAFAADSACPATPSTNNDLSRCWKS